MKKGNAAGPDDIPSEMLTALGEFGIKEITKLLNIIHDTGEISKDLKNQCTLQYPNKKGTAEYDQHHTISLIKSYAKSVDE